MLLDGLFQSGPQLDISTNTTGKYESIKAGLFHCSLTLDPYCINNRVLKSKGNICLFL